MSRRRALLAASVPTFNGKELPTELPHAAAPADEERANLYDFLDSLTINGIKVTSIYRNNDMFVIMALGKFVNIYPNGSLGTSTSGGAD